MSDFMMGFTNNLDIETLKNEVNRISSQVFELIERFDALETVLKARFGSIGNHDNS